MALDPVNAFAFFLSFFFFFFFEKSAKGYTSFFSSESQTQTRSVNLDPWVPCSLPPTEHLYLQAFSEQVCPPARHHC